MTIETATRADIPEIIALQKLAFYDQACLARSFRIRPLLATIEDMEAQWDTYRYVKGVEDGRIIASARGKMDGSSCRVGNVIVRPDRQGRFRV